jgi:hypothetical protein
LTGFHHLHPNGNSFHMSHIEEVWSRSATWVFFSSFFFNGTIISKRPKKDLTLTVKGFLKIVQTIKNCSKLCQTKNWLQIRTQAFKNHAILMSSLEWIWDIWFWTFACAKLEWTRNPRWQFLSLYVLIIPCLQQFIQLYLHKIDCLKSMPKRSLLSVFSV